MNQLTSKKAGPLKGNITVPGDKSISHRSLIMGALAVGESRISGLLEGEDVLGTAAALRAFGADIYKDTVGDWHVHGVGISGLRQPEEPLDMGNSGTGVRLLMGLVATHPIKVTFTGDASLSSRPMKRVTDPLSEFGAKFIGDNNGTLPITVQGAKTPMPISYTLPVASAQVKSAVMLAGLNTPGQTTVVENIPTRDHSERIFQYFGVPIQIDGEHKLALNRNAITAASGLDQRKLGVKGRVRLGHPSRPQELGQPARVMIRL